MNSRDMPNALTVQPLTPREEEILSLIGQGKTNRQIAEELTVAHSTVKWYVRQIYGKLGVNNREEAAGRARELGLLTEKELFSQGLRGYEIQERLGAGRYGLVYRATQTAVQREVAIKTILPRLANQPDFIRRFEFEARLVARLEHPNIVPLYDYWRDPSGAYLVMRWLRGGSLREELTGGPLSLETTSGLLGQITSALNFAHEQNVVHQDIRPANILLDEDQNAYVADFGIGLLVEQPGMPAPNPLENDYAYALSSPVAYSSPEQLRGTPPTTLSDIYNLGLLLYEMITGEHPFAALPPKEIRRRQLVEPIPLIHEQYSHVPPVVDEVIRKATNKDPALRFQNALALYTAYSGAISGKGEQQALTISRIGAEAVNPYKGLRPFTESDANDYFGREKLVGNLLARMAGGVNERILAVVGPSGSGKSSAVRAGLIPALRSGALPGSEDWFFVQMHPGRNPFEELEAALLSVAVNPPDSLLDQLHADSQGLNRALLRCLPEKSGSLFLLIDQFEELFTLVEEEETRQGFLDALTEAVSGSDSRLMLVLTLRADYYDRPLKYARFGQLLGDHTETVLPLSAAELEEAIVQPAEKAGVYFEEGLAARIIDDVRHQPGALPLLQYALTELYDNRDGQALTHVAYEEIGGVTGALAQSAETLYLSQNTQEQEALRQIFLRLIADEKEVAGAGGIRRRESLEALLALYPDDDQLRDIINSYASARLLTLDYDPLTRVPTVNVAHEALIDEWRRLRNWLAESRDDLYQQQRLNSLANEWIAQDRDPGLLLRETRLEQLAAWAQNSSLILTPEEHEYLALSLAARRERQAEEEARRQQELENARQLAETEKKRAEEQRAAARRLRRRAFLLAGALAIAAILAAATAVNGRRAAQNADEARDNLLLASTREAQAVAAVGARATAQSEAEENEMLAVAAAATADGAAMAEAAAAEEARAAREDAEIQRAAAEEERETAEAQARLATSRELAAAAAANLDEDAELSILLALQALRTAHTSEAEAALHQAVQASRIRQALIGSNDLPTFWLDYSPEGGRIFTSGEGGGVMWDAISGDVLFDYRLDSDHETWVNRAAFSPDGSAILLPIEEWQGDQVLPGIVAILDADTGEEILTFTASDGGIQDLTFNPQGTQFATSQLTGGAVKIWDLAATLATGDGVEAAALCCHDGETVWSVNYSPDGTLAVTVGDDRMVRVWEAATGRELLAIDGTNPGDAVFSPDGQYIVVGDDTDMLVFEARSGELYASAPDPQTSAALTFSPDGTRLAASNYDGHVRLWEYADGELEPGPMVLSGHRKQTLGVSFSPDGRLLASGSLDGTARIWDVSPEDSGEFGQYTHNNTAFDVDFSPDGRWLVSTSLDGTAKIWDTEAREVRSTLDHDDWVIEADFHPDGNQFATSSSDGTIRVWDVESGGEKLVIDAHEVSLEGFFSGAKGVSYAPDGQRLASGGADAIARVWDAESGEQLLELAGHSGTIHSVNYSADGRWLVTGGEEGVIKVWDPTNGQELWTLAGDPTTIWFMTFSADGSRLAASHDSGQVIVWSFPAPEADSLAVPEIVLQFEHDVQTVGKPGFSPDGTLLAVADSRQTIIHDAATGEQLANFEHAATATTFSPDGRLLATAGTDGVVRLLAANSEDLLALAKTRVTRSLTEDECRRYLHLEACPAGS